MMNSHVERNLMHKKTVSFYCLVLLHHICFFESTKNELQLTHSNVFKNFTMHTEVGIFLIELRKHSATCARKFSN